MKIKTMMAMAAFAAVAAAAPASAAPYIDFDGVSGVFGDAAVRTGADGAFSDVFSFQTIRDMGSLAATISSISLSDRTNVDFSKVTLNGVDFTPFQVGSTEFRSVTGVPVSIQGSQDLLVQGTAGKEASFSGTIAFNRMVAAVPEPASWAMMILGMGLVGATLRRGRRSGAATGFNAAAA